MNQTTITTNLIVDGVDLKSLDHEKFLEAVSEYSRLLSILKITKTPFFDYELLQQEVDPYLMIKHENLQRFGDSAIRAYISMIIGSIKEHADIPFSKMEEAMKTYRTVVIPASLKGFSVVHFLSELTFLCEFLKLNAIIVTSQEDLASLFILKKLSICKKLGMQMVCVSKSSDIDAKILDLVETESTPDNKLFPLDTDGCAIRGLFGVATVAQEMLDQFQQHSKGFSCDSSKQILSHVVVPRRHFSSCWSTVAGIALFFHCFRLKHSTDWPIVVPVEGENLPRESEGIYGISGDRLYQSSKVKRKKAIAAAKKALRKEEEEGEDEEGEDGNEEEEEEEESYSEDLSLSSPMLKRTLSILSHVPPSSFVSYDAPSRQWFLTRMQRASVGCVFEDFDTDESGDVTEKELCEVIFQLFDGGMTPLTETECSMICQTVP
ncbi:hypothetical protein ADUPG1_013794, partial [Aduncisulcus paluster]